MIKSGWWRCQQWAGWRLMLTVSWLVTDANSELAGDWCQQWAGWWRCQQWAGWWLMPTVSWLVTDAISELADDWCQQWDGWWRNWRCQLWAGWWLMPTVGVFFICLSHKTSYFSAHICIVFLEICSVDECLLLSSSYSLWSAGFLASMLRSNR